MDEVVASGTCRIYAPDGVRGCGVLITSARVVTAAHVVTQALGPDPIRGRLDVDFPFAANSRRSSATVLEYHPSMDWATLLLDEERPHEDVPGWRALEDWDLELDALGFPEGHDNGLWVRVGLRGATARGMRQLQGLDARGPFIRPGFSGGPLWDKKRHAVVGIVAARDRDPNVETAWMLPLSRIDAAIPYDASRAGVVYPLEYFGSTMLTRFFDALADLEYTGLEAAACNQVKNTLEHVANAASGCSGLAMDTAAPHRQIEQLQELYREWNDLGEKGELGARHRRETLRRIRDWRRQFVGAYASVRHHDSVGRDLSQFLQMIVALGELGTKQPLTFRRLAKGKRDFVKRSGRALPA